MLGLSLLNTSPPRFYPDKRRWVKPEKVFRKTLKTFPQNSEKFSARKKRVFRNAFQTIPDVRFYFRRVFNMEIFL